VRWFGGVDGVAANRMLKHEEQRMVMTVAGTKTDEPKVRVELLKALYFGGKLVEPGTVVTVSSYLAAELIHLQRAKLAK
jgi:hypothetical protein